MFTQPCFIRKNTFQLREKLENMGYKCCSYFDCENYAICTFVRDGRPEYMIFEIDDDFENTIRDSYPFIDCDTNEELFIAIASLRNGTDKDQWFVYDSTDCIIEEFRVYEWFICEDDKIEEMLYYDCDYINAHKATIDELIEHFKK